MTKPAGTGAGFDCWKLADPVEEAEMLAQGISYYATTVDDVRYIAPFGSPSPGTPVEVVWAGGDRD